MYFDYKNKTGPSVALLALARRYPERIQKEELIETVRRNGFTVANARMAVRNIGRFVDNDGHDCLRILSAGLRQVDQMKREKS